MSRARKVTEDVLRKMRRLREKDLTYKEIAGELYVFS